MTLRAQGKLDNAAETLRQGIKRAEDSAKSHFVVSMLMALAQIQDTMATSAESISILEQATKEAPDDHYVSELLADAHDAQQSPERAMAIYQSMQAQGGQEKDFFGMAQMMQVTGSYEQAKKVYETSLLKYYDSSHWHRGFSSVARKANKIEELVTWYEDAIAQNLLKDPERAAALCYWLGDAYYFELEDAEKAISIWEDAIDAGTLGSEESRLRFALCEAYIDKGHFDKADKILEKNCDDEEQYICRSHLLFRGMACERMGRQAKARIWYNKGFNLALKRIGGSDDPNDNYGYQMLGKALLFLGLESDAERAFQYRVYANTLQDTSGALHRAFCDVCYDSKGIRGTRFVCRSCYDIDLCQEHHQERLLGKLNLTRCQDDHTYLAVRALEPADIKKWSASASIPDETWIRSLEFQVHSSEPLASEPTLSPKTQSIQYQNQSLQPTRRVHSWRWLLLGIGFFLTPLLFALSFGRTMNFAGWDFNVPF
jgi:tetratricopeptide (TPR) repeat protein